MKIVIVYNRAIPAFLYGGTERVVWYLGKELSKMGHKVTFLVPKGSRCDFAEVLAIDPERPVEEQIPAAAGVAHFNIPPSHPVHCPYIVTYHGNVYNDGPLDINSVFVSRDHAERHGSQTCVYNGLDWDDYGSPSLLSSRSYYHFLGKAAWRVKNIKGAIDVVKSLHGEKLYVMGGERFNFKMGIRFTFSTRVKFFGMVGGEEKNELLRGSKGLLFPVRWPEPFGLAITESLYFGAPVFATPYGSLPELVTSDVGYLSDSSSGLAIGMKEKIFSPRRCHEYARDLFNSKLMAERYLTLYERVMNGETLNPLPPHATVKDWPLPWKQ